MEPRRIAIVAVSLVAAGAVWGASAELGRPMELAPCDRSKWGTPKAALKGVRPERVPGRTKVEVQAEVRDKGAVVTPADRDPPPGAVRSRPPRLRRPQVMTTTMRVETMIGAMTR